jgi:hypothetical protein
MCPDLARITRVFKDYIQNTTPSAPPPDGTEGGIESDMDNEAAAPLLSLQGVRFNLVTLLFHPCRGRLRDATTQGIVSQTLDLS